MNAFADSRVSAETLVQLSALDSLDLAFVFFDESATARFLSARAALLFDARERHALDQYENLFSPLQQLARGALTEDSGLRGPETAPVIEELELCGASGRQFLAVCYAKQLQHSPGGGIFSEQRGTAVIFHDISYFSPFFKTIEQSRRNRALIVLASSVLGRALALDPGQNELISAYQDAEKDFFRFQPAVPENLMQTDLLSGISTAVDIVDPLIVSSAKIIIDAKTPLLLDIGWPNFLRILAHLLLEAADFVGPFGVVHVGAYTPFAEIPQGKRRDDVENFVELAVEGRRKSEIPADAAPLELYIYRRYMPVHYRVLVKHEDDLENDAGTALAPRPLKLGAGGISFGANRSLSRNTLSENLLIVSHICRICAVSLEMTRPQSDVLRLSARFKLSGN